jgi:hypothetical protein
VIVLEIILQLSYIYSGFNLSQAARFTLTYTPISIVIFVGWIWQILDLEVKKVAPWVALTARPVPAADSLLLDYVGVNPLVVLHQAFRRRHWHILGTTTGLWLANAATIAASSLWFIAITSRTEAVRLERTSVFNGSAYHPNRDNISFIYPYFGHGVFNLSLPPWHSGDHVLASFKSSEKDGHDTLTGLTDAFSADLICERGSVELQGYLPVADVYHIIGHSNHTVDIPQIKVSVGQCTQTFNVTSYAKIGLDSASVSDCEYTVAYLSRIT